MKVYNREREAKPSSITPEQLGRAMSGLDLASIPPEKRQSAIMDRLIEVMAETVHDRDFSNKLKIARAVARHRRG